MTVHQDTIEILPPGPSSETTSTSLSVLQLNSQAEPEQSEFICRRSTRRSQRWYRGPDICPCCGVSTVRRWSWKGILFAIFCFPFGLWCCLKTYSQQQCPKCQCDVVEYEEIGEGQSFMHGYHYKLYTEDDEQLARQTRGASVSPSATETTTDSHAPLMLVRHSNG